MSIENRYNRELRLYNLKLRYQGFRSYNPVLLVLLTLLELPVTLVVAPLSGAAIAFVGGLRDWWCGVKEAANYLGDRYGNWEARDARHKAARKRNPLKHRGW